MFKEICFSPVDSLISINSLSTNSIASFVSLIPLRWSGRHFCKFANSVCLPPQMFKNPSGFLSHKNLFEIFDV